ncbi:DUF2207 domain-containing protein, partial [Candidatus Bipolaricaulota bacterium]|nr:DUF2207 domain-containing protein [Candidatus Bipolaricaulota bacterium]
SLRITDFAAQIVLDEEGTLHIEERLDIDFYNPHHGIDCSIPVSYRRPTGENITIDLKVISVTQDGGEVPYTVRRSGRNILVRIGDPDRTITGSHTYTLSYSVDRALLFRDDYIQLYWNVTGGASGVPINHASATITLPKTVAPGDVVTTSYVGYYGSISRGGSATLDEEGRLVFEAGSLAPGEGLTIDLAIPRDQAGIAAPTTLQLALWFLNANKYAALPILVLIGMFLLWLKTGKDPRKGTIAPRFEPPRRMHPGEAGVLIDDRVDLRDISAMVIGLAVKGYLTIKELADDEEGVTDKIKSFFGRSAPLDYEFIKKKEADADLSEVEKTLYTAIFDSAHPETRTLSSMENEFYKVLPQIKSDLYAGLIKKGYYPNNPERTRRSFASLGGMVIIAGIALGIGSGSLYMGVAIALCGLIILCFSPIMPRKTRRGVLVLQDLLGLSEYIGRAEVERIEFHDAPEKSPKLFEKLLPYAIALNLTSIWTKQFEGLLQQPPQWYVGARPGFSPALFYLGMMNLSSGMERTFVSALRTSSGGRSAWGGGGSFGGGFSGGGFGGGGGGGW